MKIALVQQHASPDKSDNITRALAAMEQAARAGAIIYKNIRLGLFMANQSGSTS